MGYRDSDDSGFSRHGMNHRDNDHPDLARDEDLRTSHSIPGDSRTGRYEPFGGRRDGQGYQGARNWQAHSDAGRDFGRERYDQGQGSGYRSNRDSGYGYGARSPTSVATTPTKQSNAFASSNSTVAAATMAAAMARMTVPA